MKITLHNPQQAPIALQNAQQWPYLQAFSQQVPWDVSGQLMIVTDEDWKDAGGIKAYLGERTFDRVRETSRLVSFDWESYRPQARKESQA